MTDTTLPSMRPKLLGYWWAPVTVLAVGLAVMAYLHPYQDLQRSDVPPGVLDSIAALDKSFGAPVKQSFKYSTRRIYSSSTGPMEVEIRVTLEPMGGGLVQRQDDWYYLKGKSVVYQERFILFRNMFSLHTRSREVAPVVHDLMGRVGWYNDTTRSVDSKVEGSAPDTPGWSMDISTDRLSDTDGKGLTLQTTPYQRRLHCERAGEVEGSEIGAMFKNSYPRVNCRSMGSDQPSERQSSYAYIPEHGIFLLLAYQQKGDSTDKLEVRGRYLSFEAMP